MLFRLEMIYNLTVLNNFVSRSVFVLVPCNPRMTIARLRLPSQAGRIEPAGSWPGWAELAVPAGS